MNNALMGIERLKENVDTLIIIPNDKLLQICDKRTSIKDASARRTKYSSRVYRALPTLFSNRVLSTWISRISQTVMRDKGIAHIGIGMGTEKIRQWKPSRRPWRAHFWRRR